MRKRSTIVVASGLAVIALAWWAIVDPTATVRDVRSAETLVLGREIGGSVYAFSIRGSGRTDGEATITLLLGGRPIRVERLSGSVNFEWGGDWYSETAEVRYEPANVQSGNLVLYYRLSRL